MRSGRARALLLGLVACGPEPSMDPEIVVHPDAWTFGDLRDDPLVAHQPDDPNCPLGTWGYEDGRLEVQTGACDYAWLVQPAEVAMQEGDTLSVMSWHQGLDAPEPGEGHLALVVDGDVVWEVWAVIPALPEVFSGEVVLPRPVPSGAPIAIHLHNHGFNSWSVGEVTRWPEGSLSP